MLMRYQAALRSDRGISGEKADHTGARSLMQRRSPGLARHAHRASFETRPADAPQDEVIFLNAINRLFLILRSAGTARLEGRLTVVQVTSRRRGA